jgi:hypothetical protein
MLALYEIQGFYTTEKLYFGLLGYDTMYMENPEDRGQRFL